MASTEAMKRKPAFLDYGLRKVGELFGDLDGALRKAIKDDWIGKQDEEWDHDVLFGPAEQAVARKYDLEMKFNCKIRERWCKNGTVPIELTRGHLVKLPRNRFQFNGIWDMTMPNPNIDFPGTRVDDARQRYIDIEVPLQRKDYDERFLILRIYVQSGRYYQDSMECKGGDIFIQEDYIQDEDTCFHIGTCFIRANQHRPDTARTLKAFLRPPRFHHIRR